MINLKNQITHEKKWKLYISKHLIWSIVDVVSCPIVGHVAVTTVTWMEVAWLELELKMFLASGYAYMLYFIFHQSFRCC